jgi:hypothetical protein
MPLLLSTAASTGDARNRDMPILAAPLVCVVTFAIAGTFRNDLGQYDETEGAGREGPLDENLAQIATTRRYVP